MPRSFHRLLTSANDFDLCSEIYNRVVAYHGDCPDVSTLCDEERVVFLVWSVYGAVGSRGFQSLFECDLPGDPQYALTAKAFRAVGCREAADAVCKTLAMFPGRRPPKDKNLRMFHYLNRVTTWPSAEESQFFAAKHDLEKSLAAFIRSHVNAFRRLWHAKKLPRNRKRARPSDEQRRESTAEGIAVTALPHWARVAFVARCARQVLPLFSSHWADPPARRLQSLRTAIELAERSAAEGQPVKGLSVALKRAYSTAAAAMETKPNGRSRGESRPANVELGTIASHIAQVAHRAAVAAAGENDPRFAAAEAVAFTASAAYSAKRRRIMNDLGRDFARLSRAAHHGNWTDQTTVPVGIWEKL